MVVQPVCELACIMKQNVPRQLSILACVADFVMLIVLLLKLKQKLLWVTDQKEKVWGH